MCQLLIHSDITVTLSACLEQNLTLSAGELCTAHSPNDIVKACIEIPGRHSARALPVIFFFDGGYGSSCSFIPTH